MSSGYCCLLLLSPKKTVFQYCTFPLHWFTRLCFWRSFVLNDPEVNTPEIAIIFNVVIFCLLPFWNPVYVDFDNPVFISHPLKWFFPTPTLSVCCWYIFCSSFVLKHFQVFTVFTWNFWDYEILFWTLSNSNSPILEHCVLSFQRTMFEVLLFYVISKTLDEIWLNGLFWCKI